MNDPLLDAIQAESDNLGLSGDGLSIRLSDMLERIVQKARSGGVVAARVSDDGQDPFGKVPFPGDAGLDLVCAESALLHSGETANIACGTALALPEGTFGMVMARSSTWAKRGLMVMPGIIDNGWRGEMRVLVYKPVVFGTHNHVEHVKRGDRLAQLLVLPLPRNMSVEEVALDELPPAERGTSGFGSSG